MSDVVDDAQTAERLIIADAQARRQRAAGCDAGPCWVSGVPLCRGCGDEIPAARIKAMPRSPYCTSCQDRRERGLPLDNEATEART